MLDHIDKTSGTPLYEQLYEDIKRDILSGRLPTGAKLPSKRSISEQLGISIVTVENAYSQLIAEGYVRAAERSGYFVQYSGDAVEVPQPPSSLPRSLEPDIGETCPEPQGDSVFPFTVWARLMRSVILEKGTALLRPVSSGGAEELRAAISEYLYHTRGISVSPRQIIVGSGTEYLYNLLVQFFGRDRRYGIENPGFEKLPRIYSLNGADFERINLDEQGMSLTELEQSGVSVAHISPAHHYPTGIVMPISRRLGIMRWAEQSEERFIIEDDYDSEFRRSGKPVPTMFGMDTAGKVIYINTFSQTIAPSVRISYMCLPERLIPMWEERLGFYACSVPSFEQYTLARFISGGYFERHISRMRKHYRRIFELVARLSESFGGDVSISEETAPRAALAGLHFTITIRRNAAAITEIFTACGIRIKPLSEYYTPPEAAPKHRYVANYAAAREDALVQAVELRDRRR